MADRIDELLQHARQAEEELLAELQRRRRQFAYRVRRQRVYFSKKGIAYQRRYWQSLWRYFAEAPPLHYLTVPMIWGCILPTALLDLAASVYQATCFPIYGIPTVKRADYLVFDHQFLKYLNAVEKVNCWYCSYFNGVVGYLREIGARTEQFWCPIKHAKRVKTLHSRYKLFFDYGDAERYRRELSERRRDFDDLDK